MSRRVSFWTCAAPTLFALCAAGCGGPEVYPVDGRVKYADGQAATDLAGYGVTFESADNPQVSGFGVIQPDGTFHVGTYEDADGAVPGKHRITITPPAGETDGPPPKQLINRKYGDFETSGLEAEIGPDNSEVTLTVERAGK